MSVKDGGLPPDSVVQDDDEILADSERLVKLHHDPAFGAMVRVALAPCSPFSVTPELMRRTAELAERLDVRLHTHLAEDPDEDTYCLATFGRRPVEHFEEVGWLTSRSWVAHCIYPDAGGGGPARHGRRRGGALPELEHAHRRGRLRSRPASCVLPGLRSDWAATGRRPPTARRCGSRPGRRCCWAGSGAGPPGWRRARCWRSPPAAARRASAALGKSASYPSGAAGDLVCWPQEGVQYAGALTDPVEAWLRCGPVSARHTVVAGRVRVQDGVLTVPGTEEKLRLHAAAAARVQGVGA